MPVGDDGMPWAFRHKAAFVFGPGGPKGLVMGHYAAGGRTIVPVVECPVHGARANRIAFRLRDELARARVPAAGPRLDGVLRHVIVRTSADERDAVLLLVVTRNAPSLRRPVRALLASADRPDGFFLNLHDQPSPYMVGRTTIRLDGHAHVRERLVGPTFLVSPTAFFQTNPVAAAALVDLVLDAAGPTPRRVLDLYAGSGLFTLALAMRGHQVTAVEENRAGDARRRAQRRGQPARRARGAAHRQPRRGRAADARSAPVRRRGARPASPGMPARGDRRRVPRGWPPGTSSTSPATPRRWPPSCRRSSRTAIAATRFQPVDMFPHTPHIETVALFERTSASAPAESIAPAPPARGARMKRRR